MRFRLFPVTAAVVAAAAGATAAVTLPTEPSSAQTSEKPQRFFKTKLLEDRRTARSIRSLLGSRGSGFVDRSVVFRDLTGDDKTDAIVRVNSGGAAGTVGVYVFSTDGGAQGAPPRAVLRRQKLRRGLTSLTSDGKLVVTTAKYEAGNELCCPARLLEITFTWDEERDRFVSHGRELPGPSVP